MGVQERKEREKQARQEAILTAAQQVFLAKGVDQATIDEIAEKAELSKGTIYLYFQSKEELYISVLLRGLELLYHQIQDVHQEVSVTPADTLLLRIKEIYYQFYKEYPEFLYMSSLFHHGRTREKISPQLDELMHESARKSLQVISEIIEAGVAAGLFRAVDCWKTANSLWGAATGVMDLFDDCAHLAMVNLSLKETLDYTMELLLAGLKTEQS